MKNSFVATSAAAMYRITWGARQGDTISTLNHASL